MYSYSLSMTRQKTIRAGIGMSPANFNIQIPPKSHEPIAWMQSTGLSDGICKWVANEGQKTGAKFIAIEHGTDNGCSVPNPIPTWTSGGMLCNDEVESAPKMQAEAKRVTDRCLVDCGFPDLDAM
jgi:hypothetical protein